jgi:hypothetical protein
MEKLFYIISIFFAGVLFTSCKKTSAIKPVIASLTIVNGATDVANLAVNFAPAGLVYAHNQTFISSMSFMEFGLTAGANTLNLISSADTTQNLYHGTLNLVTGGVYSFYVAGEAPNYQTILMQDNIPIYPDSAAGVRFINLSPDSQPLNVTLQGSTGNVFSSLTYKKITAFKKYTATSSIVNNGGYNFNVTDATGNVLTTFDWVPMVFNESNTLVITGSYINGTLSVFEVNNFYSSAN